MKPSKKDGEATEQENQRLAELQSRHIDEKVALHHRLSARRNAVEIQTQEFYKPFEMKLVERVDELTQALNRKGVSGWLYETVNGQDARDEIERLQQSLANSWQRKNEQLGKEDMSIEYSKQELEHSQRLEFDSLETDYRDKHATHLEGTESRVSGGNGARIDVRTKGTI